MKIIIGLTGNIASGKSTVAEIFAKHGAAVLDSDQVVAELYQNELVDIFKKEFPEVIEDEKISKNLIKELIIPDAEKKQKLESIVHPLVRQKAAEFVAANQDKLVVLEIQLLFETKAQEQSEYGITHTVVVTAPFETRLERAKKSRDITEEEFTRLDSLQMPESEKSKLADFVIDNSDGMNTENQVLHIIEQLNQ